jgi:putative hydrolase of the HAD superfamily
MPVRLPRPEVVFFDLFGTLFRWSKSPRDAVADALATVGRPVDPAEVYRKQREVERLFPPHDEYPAENEWQYWRHYDGELLLKLGVRTSKEALTAIREEFERNVRLDLQEDALPTLQGLKAAGARIGVISNATFGMMRDFERLGLGAFFERPVFSQAVNVRKPDPHIFLLALSKFGCPPTRAWMVGDDPDTDIKGARGVGVVPILVDRAGSYPDSNVARVADLREVVGLFQGAET